MVHRKLSSRGCFLTKAMYLHRETIKSITFVAHLSRMEFPPIINWASLFPFQGLLSGILHFYSNSNRTFCKQTAETLIRRRVLWRLIWVCTDCICPTNRTLGLYGLVYCDERALNSQTIRAKTKLGQGPPSHI